MEWKRRGTYGLGEGVEGVGGGFGRGGMGFGKVWSKSGESKVWKAVASQERASRRCEGARKRAEIPKSLLREP